MKRMIVNSANTTRGEGRPKDPEKQKLRKIVNDIYDEVEQEGVVDYYAYIKSAGKGYYIDYFRLDEGWMSKETANRIANEIENIAAKLGYSDITNIELILDDIDYLRERYGHDCYIVRVKVG